MVLLIAACFLALFPPVIGLSAVKPSTQSSRGVPGEAGLHRLHRSSTALDIGGSPDEELPEKVSKKEERAIEASHQQFEAWEEHEEVTPVSNAIAVAVLGILFFIMSLFYLVNYPDEDIQRATWSCLSSTISIFCAVLIWGGLKEVMHLCISPMLQEEEEHHDLLPHSKADVIIPFVEFSLTFGLLQFVLFSVLHRPRWLSALSTIGAHVLGFSAIDAFGTFQHVQPFRDTWYYSALCVPLCAVVLLAAFHFFDMKRRQTAAHTKLGCAHHWLVECCDSENESAGFILGLLASQVVRFAIGGKLEPNEGYPWHKTYSQVAELFVAACAFGALVVLSSKGLLFMEHKRSSIKGHPQSAFEEPDLVIRSIQMTQATLSMAFGWCFLHCGRWLFWAVTNDHGVGDGDLMLARLLQALVFSYSLFAGIFVLDLFADQSEDDRGYRALIRGCGLVLGLSWESAFDEAIKDLGRNFETETQRTLLTNSFAIAVCVVVLPAWKMYILPNSMGSPAGSHSGSHCNSPSMPEKACPAASVLMSPRGLMTSTRLMNKSA